MAVAYHSTRSSDHTVLAKQAILQGIAPDGGLYIQDSIGEKPLDLAKVCAQGFKATAFDVLSALLDDYSAEELELAVIEGDVWLSVGHPGYHACFCYRRRLAA